MFMFPGSARTICLYEANDLAMNFVLQHIKNDLIIM
jgi:hypothetical protein